MDGGHTSLGQTIRELRHAHGMTLQQLGEKIGRTAGFISQVERGLARPSVATIEKLGSALGVSSSFFFSDPVPEEAGLADIVTRASNRRRFTYAPSWIDGDGFVDHLLSPKLNGNLLVKHTRLAPLGNWTKQDASSSYEVALYILSGVLSVSAVDKDVLLSEGDYMQFAVAPSDSARSFRNPSDTQSTELIMITSPALLQS